MPRRRQGTRISDSGARKVAGLMCFAAAAEGLGGLYGSTSMERALCFSPRARAELQAPSDPSSTPRHPKRPWPTGGCKKWLHGHVANDQTLSLIAQKHPQVAQRMRQARDGDVVKALTVAPDDYRFVGTRICKLSPDQVGNYLGCMAWRHCSPIFASRLTADLLHRALDGIGLEVLVAVIGLDRQLSSPRAYATTKCLEDAFAIALKNSANIHPEIAFAKDALADTWSERESTRGVQAQARDAPFRSANVRSVATQTPKVHDQATLRFLGDPHLELQYPALGH